MHIGTLIQTSTTSEVVIGGASNYSAGTSTTNPKSPKLQIERLVVRLANASAGARTLTIKRYTAPDQSASVTYDYTWPNTVLGQPQNIELNETFDYGGTVQSSDATLVVDVVYRHLKTNQNFEQPSDGYS